VELAVTVAESKETTFDIKHTAPQHRQYLEYGVCVNNFNFIITRLIDGNFI